MTNEELAEKVKAGEPGAALELWEAVRRFVEVKARAYFRTCSGRASMEDLTQAGFIAVLDAAEVFDPNRDAVFLTLLNFKLKNRFREEIGIRSSKRDALQYSDSLDAPAYTDSDGDSVAAQIEDEGAALAFCGIEYEDFIEYARRVIGAALSHLHPDMSELVRLCYLDGLTMTEAAERAGYSNKQTASAAAQGAFYVLRHCSHTKPLHECLEAFYDYAEYHYAACIGSLTRYKECGISATEAGALVK